jgi:hypothetical protein
LEFRVSILSVRCDFLIKWGDTVRIRDEYYPYFLLGVEAVKEDLVRIPRLNTILLYSFKGYWSNVYDEFDEKACLRNSKFGKLALGSILQINGPLFRKSSQNKGEFYQPFTHVVVQCDLVGDETHPDDSWSPAPSEWLLGAKAPESELASTSTLLVGWESADVVR